MSFTLTEFRLLEDLIRAQGRVRTRETLLSGGLGVRLGGPFPNGRHARPAPPRQAGPGLGLARSPCAGSGYRIQDPGDPARLV